MSLPELEWQIIYGRAAWAVALTALAITFWPRSWRLSRSTIVFLLVGAAALKALPNEASLAYWVGLALQWPSGALIGLCLIKLHSAWQGKPESTAMPPSLAVLIALTGGALYLDAIGWISQGFYYWGFSPYGAPLTALFLAVTCSVAAVRGHARPQALALLLALVIFAVLRLPTGNLWDALLDPVLWAWALVSLGSRCRRWWTRRYSSCSPARGHECGSRTNP